MLHEMLHVFVIQFACGLCIPWENWASHGRAWQRIAKAIGEQSLRLLGVKVDMSRLESFLYDRNKYDGDGHRHTLHDLEAWGFWEPTNR